MFPPTKGLRGMSRDQRKKYWTRFPLETSLHSPVLATGTSLDHVTYLVENKWTISDAGDPISSSPSSFLTVMASSISLRLPFPAIYVVAVVALVALLFAQTGSASEDQVVILSEGNFTDVVAQGSSFIML